MSRVRNCPRAPQSMAEPEFIVKSVGHKGLSNPIFLIQEVKTNPTNRSGTPFI